MFNIVTQKSPAREVWLQQLAKAVTDPDELLRLLSLKNDPELRAGSAARALFPLRVPHTLLLQKCGSLMPMIPFYGKLLH
ncbi:L-lysine 2,3-aminomutase [Arsenophonus endosymbiont of Bemisia tabaci Q2]|nr:L-lysine 2,3-aminomutase [Arsenophonus endosymbiont of Bemisia tabaci Q2]